MSPGLAIHAINHKALDVASLVKLRYESAPYEHLKVDFNDVSVEAVEIESEDSYIVEETIVLIPRKIGFTMIPSGDYMSSGVSGELTCSR